ncbi:hypothetical protein D3C73_1146340 [compost metagenome]
MRPEAVGPERCEGQQYTQPQAAEQALADLRRATAEHRVHGTDEITQVVGGGDQPGCRQVDLPFAEQVRHLRGEGEAPDAHGHHERDEAGE